MKEPKFRFVTEKAKRELSIDFNFGYDINKSCQDWEWTIGNKNQIEEYITHYINEIDDDKKFALMEIIIQAIEDQENEKDFDKYSNGIRKLLFNNFLLHEYSIYYWSDFENDLNDSWKISKMMREIFQDKID